MSVLYNTFVLEIDKYSLWFSPTMAQYSLENVTQKATKTMVFFYHGRTNTNTADNLFAKSKRNIILFCYFSLSICIYKSLKTSKTIEPNTVKLGTRLSLRL